jgi:hypothetical protein
MLLVGCCHQCRTLDAATASLDNFLHLLQVLDTDAEKMQYFKKFMKIKPVGTITEEHIAILGPTVAKNDGLYTFATIQDGKRVNVKARYTFVYHKIGSSWKIVTHHSSKLPNA